MDASRLLMEMQRTVEKLGAFNEIAKALTSTLEVGEVLKIVLRKVSELLNPTNWSLILQAPSGELYFEICVGPGAERLRDMRFRPGDGIAGAVFVSGAPRLVDDVARDAAFDPRFDASTAFRTRSVLAVPLRSKGRILGVLELVNGHEGRVFTTDDLDALVGVSDFVAIALENAEIVRRLQALTITDEHTGLFNARHLKAVLEKEVERALRFKHCLSLVFLDLDGFKQVNDTHGHLVGSALLLEVGKVLSRVIRQVDFAFRYGGDEFAVVLLETDAGSARQVGARIRDELRNHRFLDDRGLDIRLTASLGVATFPDHATTATTLVEAADKAMYRVKAAGRDGVQVAPHPTAD